MTFDEVEVELLKLEQPSKIVMNLDIRDYILDGRPFYIAKLLWGPEKIWICAEKFEAFQKSFWKSNYLMAGTFMRFERRQT